VFVEKHGAQLKTHGEGEKTQGKTWDCIEISAFPSLPCVFLCLFRLMHLGELERK